MSACALALALPTSLPIRAADDVAELVRQLPIESASSLADPPLKPPPII